MPLIYAATGHRPPKLGGYHTAIDTKLRGVAHNFLTANRPDLVIVGMALGWDMAVAEVCCALGIPYVAAIPFDGQESKWPIASRIRYNNLLCMARNQVIVCTGGYSPAAMLARDEWMVDHAGQVVALWNGAPDGGTYKTIKYAESKSVPVWNLWDKWSVAR